LFKLSIFNAFILVAAPSFLARYFISEDKKDRIQNFWRIHRNREFKGLKGTYTPSGIYNDKVAGNVFQRYEDIYPVHVPPSLLLKGYLTVGIVDLPDGRFKKAITEQPQWFEDIDKEKIKAEVDTYERLKAV
jgi:hypothetical protein